MKSRFDFINQILIEELYDKRLPALTSFREGLDSFGLVKLMQINPDTWKPFFVTKTGIRDEPLTAKKFLSLIHSEPKNDDEERAYTHFRHFLDIQENQSECIPVLAGDVPVLHLLLKFCTSNMTVPPLGLKTSIKLLYGKEELKMPDSDTCFNVLKIPVIYKEYSEFEQVMLAALRHGSCSFSASR